MIPKQIAFRWLATALIVISSTSISTAGAQSETGSITVLALDCRGADLTVLATCPPAEGIPFEWRNFGVDPYNGDLIYTGTDGSVTVEATGSETNTFTYITEIVWTDQPVAPLIGNRSLFVFPGDVATITFVLVDPEQATRGQATLYYYSIDCSDGNPSDLSTCLQLPNVMFFQRYWGVNGSTTNEGRTSPEDGSFGGVYSVPAFVTINFVYDYSDLGLIPVDPVQEVLLMPGDFVELYVVFIDEDDEPVTELPDTGTGPSLHRGPSHLIP